MKYKDIYQKPELVKAVAEALHRTTTKNWTLMEVCGGQTHSIVKYGLDALLPPQITLLHGPGCPVCVTPVEKIDRAIALAKDHNVILFPNTQAAPWQRAYSAPYPLFVWRHAARARHKRRFASCTL